MSSVRGTPTSWPAYARAFGTALRKRRLAEGLTQEQAARVTGITRTHYQQVERGLWSQDAAANPSLKVVVKIAQALGVEPAELLPDGSHVKWTEDRTAHAPGRDNGNAASGP